MSSPREPQETLDAVMKEIDDLMDYHTGRTDGLPTVRADDDEVKALALAYKHLAVLRDEQARLTKELESVRAAQPITGDTSDGYHTFDELYAYRKAFNALLFNEWAALGVYDVHKAWAHSDGESCFGGGWFIVVAQTPHGQVSNHYKTEDWELFRIPERERGAEWDGHTPQIALERLLQTAVTASAESSLSTLEGQIRALEKYAAHQSRCPLSRTYRYQHIMHVENHLDDDGPLDECTSDICRAWGKAGPDGEPDCTCGLSALRRSRETIPPHEKDTKEDTRVDEGQPPAVPGHDLSQQP